MSRLLSFAFLVTVLALVGFRHATPVPRSFVSLVPVVHSLAGTVPYIQPLDTAVNKTIKGKISDLLDLEINQNPELWETGKFSIGDRRILMTWVVRDAWEWLHDEESKLIISSFRHVGISLAVDGSEDSELRIKALENLEIGNWEEGGLHCNLDCMGKTGAGELQWDAVDEELLDLKVALDTAKELLRLEHQEEGEYVNTE